MPAPRKHPIAVMPASEVPQRFAIGASQVASAAARISGSSGSAIVTIRRGAIVSRPARASATSVASIDG